ncbi:MAG: PHP domain-containing protein [Ruminococcaceae bacterium]|nr:PHP domain-containing protein [Oscillospiraceae bacterium]
MRYIVDNDLHIHSKISLCSNDPEQTNERILQYAKDCGIKTLCLTDHFWDETVEGASSWYEGQSFKHISQALPLPTHNGIRFLFGCETELTRNLILGVSKKKLDLLDFIVIPTTHFHMKGYTISEEEDSCAESKAKAWIKRFDAVLNMDLPFNKIGFAHLTCGLIDRDREQYLKILSLLPCDEMERLFTKAAKLGVGIELNSLDMSFPDSEADVVLRPYRIARSCGCKFYCGSDAHHPETLDKAKAIFERAIDMLELTEDDKFII